jgi:transcriptional regulator with PAS, ATPase and Fis domain/cytochrome c-type biogenesis protein CcmH/NrfG
MSQVTIKDIEFYKGCQNHLTQLLNLRDYGSAARYFDSIQSEIEGVNAPECGVILRLAANSYGRLNNYPKCLQLIRKAIGILSRAIGESNELGESYMVLGEALREMGNTAEAEKAYRDAESIFRRNDNISRSGDVLNLLAGVSFRRGEFDAALKFLLEAIETARKTENRAKLAYLFGNIGRVYQWLGRAEAAEEHIRLNVDLSAEIGDELESARAWLSMGYLYIQTERFGDAASALEKALDFIRRNGYAKEEVIYLTYAGELYLNLGQDDIAENSLREAEIRGNSISPESMLAARPLRHLASLAAKRGDYHKALSIASRALTAMEKLEFPVEAAALYRIIGLCHQKMENFDKAQKMLVKSIEILEEKKAKFELAESLAALGQLETLDNAHKLIYLSRAEELYSSCGLKLKALAIEKIMASLEIRVGPRPMTDMAAVGSEADFPTKNPKMLEIVAQLRLIRNSELPILIMGETGTGKDFLAKYFHALSRPNGPFISVNCAAVPESLIESELFGFSKGAFTGADSGKQGLFLAANKGIILLNEIGELPLPLQAKLLSVIDNRRLRPLGTHHEISLDIVVIAATNRDLSAMVKDGSFRADLYYRLAGVAIYLPPLRERKEDIPYLLELFMRRQGLLKNGETASPDLLRLFVGYDWPGNIRQLENQIKRLAALWTMARDGSIAELTRGFFDDKRRETANSLFEQVERFERQLLMDALIASNWNKSEAARLLSIHESTLRAKMKRYRLAEACA